MNTIVRGYSDSDFEAVSKIIFDSFGYEKSHVRSDTAYEFVAEIDGVVVGYFILNEMIDIIRNFKVYHIDYVCVDDNYRGKGIGTTMMNFAIQYAKENNIRRLELTSSNSRISAHKLYEKMGFDKRDSSIFRKELI